MARAEATPGVCSASATAVRRLLSITSPSTGRSWMVTSRPTSEDQAMADFCTSTTPPKVTAERKVMMAMSSTRVRPATERSGTIGAARGLEMAGRVPGGTGGLATEHHLAVIEQHAGKGKIFQQGQFVRSEDDGGS